MGFRNPVTSAPFYRFRDEFYWPCVSGEQLPPVLGGAASYAQYLGRPSLSIGGSSSATWPNVPRVSPTNPDAATLTISFFFGVTSFGGAGQLALSYGTGAGPVAGMHVETFTAAPKTYQFNMANAAASGQTIDTGIVPSLTAWDEIEIVLTATASTMTVTQAGVATTVRSTKLWLPGDPTIGLALSALATAGSGHITQLRASYT